MPAPDLPDSPRHAGDSPTSSVGPDATPPPGAPVEWAATPQRGRRLPERIGDYRILDVLGEGGMGVVYLAEQREPVERRVAIKVVRTGMESREAIARFEAERQALAMMDHPGVARIHDAGVTEAGLPYFVMELVRGLPITRYCDERSLPVNDRLRLFIDVCAAVQHAHQKGVIHRDLKPSNILVETIDNRPAPRIIDFGVAKAASRRLTDRTYVTEQGRLIGTPEYMSPEQAEMSPLDVDTRSDVYALGVILYELLTSALPFESGPLRSAPLGEIQRMIREVDPPSPSARLTTRGGSVEAAAKARATDIASLARSIRGDLDWIVMKALEKDRARRYQSAGDFAQDVQRQLDHLPVEARRPTAGYRLRKFARRHRVGVAAGALISLAIIAGGAVAAAGFVRAVRAERIARSEATRAETEARTAGAVNGFLRSVLANASPRNNPRGLSVTVRETLDESLAQVESGAFADQPAVDASIRGVLGETYSALGLTDPAVRCLREAIDIRLRLGGPDDSHARAYRSTLGVALSDATKHSEAEAIFRAALDSAVRVAGEETGEAARLMDNIATVRSAQGDQEEAERLTRRSLEIRRRVYGDQHEEVAIGINNLAARHIDAGRIGEAERMYRESLDMLRRIHPEAHPDVALLMINLAAVRDSMGDHAGSADTASQALEMATRLFGDSHPMVGKAWSRLGMARLSLGDRAGAIEAASRSLEIQRRFAGPDDLTLASALANLAHTVWSIGDHARAEALARESLDIRRRRLPPGDNDLATVLAVLGNSLMGQSRWAEAEPVLRECLAIRLAALPAGHWTIANTRSVLGEAIGRQGRNEEAEPLLIEGFTGMQNVPAPIASRRAEALSRLIDFYERSGRPADAARWRTHGGSGP